MARRLRDCTEGKAADVEGGSLRRTFKNETALDSRESGGRRALAKRTNLRFRYRLEEADSLQVVLFDSKTKTKHTAKLQQLERGSWAEKTVPFDVDEDRTIDEVWFLVPKNGELLLDDLLLYEP